jgi:flavin-dependent dehydrogenase
VRARAVVAGAGPAGAVAAVRLARAGLKVCLVDGSIRRRFVGETLSPAGKAALVRAVLWTRMPAGVALPCSSLQAAWTDPVPVSQSFLTNPYGSAWHIDRERFDAWLVSEAIGAGAQRVSGMIHRVERSGGHWVAEVWDEQGFAIVRADYLVVATGRESRFRSQLGAPRRLDSLCVVGGFQPSQRHTTSLLVEAVPTGWWYSAPSPAGGLFAGLVTDARFVSRGGARKHVLRGLDAAPFTRERLLSTPSEDVIAAVSSALSPSAGDAWIAVGDAALARDPISGEGIASAIRSGWEGAGTILEALEGNALIWEAARRRGEATLRSYCARWSSTYRAQRRWPAEPFWTARHNLAETNSSVGSDAGHARQDAGSRLVG